jgi:leader peptidase (prepilin peptidase)/N-methyltransferase
MSTTILAVIGVVLGLVVGSFVNVVAYRIPRGESVVRPPSACPACAAPISPRDNVPVLSWVLLRGRCRRCGEAISVRYPLVEAATAALFAGAVAVVGPQAVLPAYWWAGGVVMALTLTDIDVHRIPNRILYPGTAVAVVLLGLGALIDGEAPALLRGLGGGAAYFFFLLVVALAARGGFGFGDVKLAFLLGVFLAYVSWEVLAVGVFGSFLIGGLASIALLILRRVGRRDAIAFGPAMILGAYLALAVGERVADWYLG